MPSRRAPVIDAWVRRAATRFALAAAVPAAGALAQCDRAPPAPAEPAARPPAPPVPVVHPPVAVAPAPPVVPGAPAADAAALPSLANPDAGRGPNRQPASRPPYDLARMQAGGGSHATGMCGRTTCWPEPAAEPLRPAPAPFQRCDLVQPSGLDGLRGLGPGGGGGGGGLGSFSAYHTASRRNAGEPTACCYLAWQSCGGRMGGRAYRPEQRAPVVADVVASSAWIDAPAPATFGASSIALALAPDAALRGRLAAAWSDDAAFEHASVASFAALALELVALGAPPELVAGAHRAAIDEVAHAQAAFAIASAYAGAPRGPGPLDVARESLGASWADVLRECVFDGCAGEGAAALVARVLAAECCEPSVASFHARVAEDEQEHAALAFATVAWIVRAHGAPARRELARCVAALRDNAGAAAIVHEDDGADLARHGLAGRALRASLAREAVRGAVLPALEAVLAA